ncbi:MAG TPA: fumarylacetoacetate hydrolase family protein [Acidimicrobiales bacterium]|nr:fumarylacetoacetate hydrolase family protein [Acidimicrobiales bacterium]
MRFCTYRRGDADVVGLVEDGTVLGLPDATGLLELLGGDGGGLARAAERARREPAERRPVDEVELRAPLPVPPSIRDFLAFEEHRRNTRGGGEVDPDWYELPIFYFSNPAAVHGPRDEVAIAPGSAEWDYELEFAAVIGTAGRDLRPDEAEAHIAGYTVLCDFSARDLQRREMRQGLGPAKGKDSATSLGPWLVTPDELAPYRSRQSFALDMEVEVNGRRYGGGRLDDLYWSFGEMIAYASRGTEVRPGDVFGSGTVGTGCILEHAALGRGAEFPYLAQGDEVVLRVENVGELRHRIAAATPTIPLRP